MKTKTKSITFARVIGLQAAMLCFATNSFSCNFREMLQYQYDLTYEQANYTVKGSAQHTMGYGDKVENRRARVLLLRKHGLLEEYMHQRMTKRHDKPTAFVAMRLNHLDEPHILEVLNTLAGLSNIPPVVIEPTLVYEGLHKVLKAVYGVASRPLYKGELTTRRLIHLLLSGETPPETMDMAYMKDAETAHALWVAQGVPNPRADSIQALIAESDPRCQALVILGLPTNPDLIESYDAWIAEGVPNPSMTDIVDYAALDSDEEDIITRQKLVFLREEDTIQNIALFDFGLARSQENLRAFNAISAYRDPTAQEIKDYLTHNTQSPADQRQRALIIMGVDYTDANVQRAYDALKETINHPRKRDIHDWINRHGAH